MDANALVESPISRSTISSSSRSDRVTDRALRPELDDRRVV